MRSAWALGSKGPAGGFSGPGVIVSPPRARALRHALQAWRPPPPARRAQPDRALVARLLLRAARAQDVLILRVVAHALVLVRKDLRRTCGCDCMFMCTR